MAEGADPLVEQFASRGVVHVDVMRVGKQEFYIAQSIFIPRGLAHVERNPVTICPPIDRTGAHDLALRIDYLKALAVEVGGIVDEIGEHFIFDDRLRHSPVGVHHHTLHLVAEHRGLRFGLADNDLGAPGNAAIVHDAQFECGLIYKYVALAWITRKPPHALHVHHELLNIALVGAGVERIDSSLVEATRLLHAAGRLEFLERFRELPVERFLKGVLVELLGLCCLRSVGRRLDLLPGESGFLGEIAELEHAITNHRDAGIASAELDALASRNRFFTVLSHLGPQFSQRGLHRTVGGVRGGQLGKVQIRQHPVGHFVQNFTELQRRRLDVVVA